MAHTIASALQFAKAKLAHQAFYADAIVLLAHVLQLSTSYLLAFSERSLSPDQFERFEKLLEQRADGVPVAYLTGHREFWSLDFWVTPDVLIPRPETELLVELVLQHVIGEDKKIVDLGTGSGAIALALAYEKPSWEMIATDVSEKALNVAKKNATRLNLSNVTFLQGEWCAPLPQQQKFDAIVSNPPYLAKEDPAIEKNTARYEPHRALFAERAGLQDIQQIIKEARHYLTEEGYLMLEHGFQQADAVRKLLIDYQYREIDLYQDLAGCDRVTIAKKFC